MEIIWLLELISLFIGQGARPSNNLPEAYGDAREKVVDRIGPLDSA
jgi:hypothetical protein